MRSDEIAAPRRRHPFAGLPAPFWNLVLATLINRLGGFVVPFLSLYLSIVRGASASSTGLIAAFFGAGAIVGGPIGGSLADHIGRKRSIVLGLVANAAAMIALVASRSKLELVVACFALGVTNELPRAPMQAMVADLVPEADRTRAYGAMYWASNAGFALASVCAGIAMTVSYRLMFIIDAATCLLCAVVIAARVPETLVRATAGSPARRFELREMMEPFRDAAFRRFFFATLILAIAIFQFHIAMPLDMKAHGISTTAYGLLVAMNGVLVVLLQPFAPSVALRFPRPVALAGAALLTGGGLGIFAFGSTIPIYVLGIFVFTLGEVCQGPLNPTVVSELSPSHLRGTYQGAYHLVFSIAGCAAPLIGGAMLQTVGGPTLWIGCLVLGALSAAVYLAFPSRSLDKGIVAATIHVRSSPDANFEARWVGDRSSKFALGEPRGKSYGSTPVVRRARLR